MKFKTWISACGLTVCLLAQPVAAGPLEDGWAALVRGDYASALKLIQPLADQGDARAQTNLGFMYFKGYGVSQDFAEALKWYQLAAEQGDAIAQDSLGGMYDNGDGVLQDFIQAHMWYNLSAAGFPASEAEHHYDAVKKRNYVAAKMTPDQVAEAQRLAQEWLAAHPKP